MSNIIYFMLFSNTVGENLFLQLQFIRMTFAKPSEGDRTVVRADRTEVYLVLVPISTPKESTVAKWSNEHTE